MRRIYHFFRYLWRQCDGPIEAKTYRISISTAWQVAGIIASVPPKESRPWAAS